MLNAMNPKGITVSCALCFFASATQACSSPEESETDFGESSQALSGAQFDVDFDACTEYVGIGFVPRENARPLVPAAFELAGDEDNAVIVVRVAGCEEVSIDGRPAHRGTLAHIGISLVGPDETADINNYQLWYSTTNGTLKATLGGLGVPADVDQIVYEFEPGGEGVGPLHIESTPPHAPPFTIEGTAIAPATDPVVFTASWWSEGEGGTVRMRAVFPDIQFSGASTTLTTPAGSALAQLIGGTSLTFPLLDSLNAVGTADMNVAFVE